MPPPTMRQITIIIGILAVALLLVGCIKLGYKQEIEETNSSIKFGKITNFEDGFNAVKQIDNYYNTNFRKEQIGKLVVALENIPDMQADLDRLARHITGKKYTDFEALTHNARKTEKELTLIFIAARYEMLESEKEFQLGYKNGNAGLVGDGFFCDEQPLIMESLDHFNQSIRHGLNATYFFDVLLTQTKEITHDFIGVNANKPPFYNTKFQDMFAQLKKNRNLVISNCANVTKRTYVVIE